MIMCLLMVLTIVSHLTTLLVSGPMLCDFCLKADMPLVNKAFSKGVSDKTQKFVYDPEWLISATTREKVTIKSHDGLDLVGYTVTHDDDQSDKWVILMHGYRGSFWDMTGYAKRFFEEGYNILIPSQRGHMESQGEYITMGYLEKYDLLEWIEFVGERNTSAKIALFGTSMGASTVMMSLGLDLPSSVKVAVADCGYTSVLAQLEYLLGGFLGFSENSPLMQLAVAHAKEKLGIDFADVSSTEALKSNTIPTIFVHGKEDRFVPFSMLNEVYNSAILLEEGVTKQKLEIAGAKHTLSASVDPETYYLAVLSFMGKFMN